MLRCIVPVLMATFGVSLAASAAGDDRQGADRLKSVISLRFPGVAWVDRKELMRWMAPDSGSRVVLLDTRLEAEFAVSHLEGATRVDPDALPSSLSPLPDDAKIVVYCSVGYRSAAVARRLSQAGYENIYNLEGGIFGWANGGEKLYQGAERASKVHPYSGTWGRLLDDEFHP